MIEIEQIPVLSDNYVYLARDPVTESVAAIDPAVDEPILNRLRAKGWRLTHILNTHHHPDHVGGNLALKAATGCTIVGYGPDAVRIPGIDVRVEDGDVYAFGNEQARVIAVPGHTLGHIAYWFKDSDTLFCGDTLFAMGCGRLFEGTPEQMWHSLLKIRSLPDRTQLYCAHEYTQANARFAVTIDPINLRLRDRMNEIDRLRAAGQPTVPSSLAVEKATNPFLRADDDELRREIGMADAAPVRAFAEIRARKDVFRPS